MTEMTKMADILSTASYVCFALAGLCFVLAVFFWFKHKIPSVIGDLSGKTARKSIERMRASNEKSGDKSFKPSYINAERGKLTETMSGLKATTSGLGGKTEQPAPKKAEKPAGRKVAPADYSQETDLLEDNRFGNIDPDATQPLDADETELLSDATELLSDATELLVEETELLSAETEMLKEEVEQLYYETALLSDETEQLSDTVELAEETAPLVEETEILSDIVTVQYDDNVTDELTSPLAEESPAKPAGKKLTMIDDVVEIHTGYYIDVD